MPGSIKRKTLLIYLLGLAALFFFAAGLPGLELQPGIPWPDLSTEESGTAAQPFWTNAGPDQSYYTFAGLILVLILAYVTYKLLSGVPWKEILDPFLVFACFLLILAVLMLLPAGIPWQMDPGGLAPPPPQETVTAPGAPLGPSPRFLLWLVGAGLALGTAFLGTLLLRAAARRRQSPDALLQEAERAVQALRSGLDFRNVILSCYRKMSLALQEQHGIELAENMTAREFERLLEARGLPHDPVHRLTGLFEAARYGRLQPGPQEEHEAVACLAAILDGSRKGSEG